MNKNFLLFCLCLATAALNHKTSIGAKEKIREVRQISASLEHEQEKSSVLVAEWTYINRFERLDKLSDKHLKLSTIRPEQIVRLDNIKNNTDLANAGFDRQIALLTPRKKPSI